MDSAPKFVRWVELPEAKPVKFGDLLALIAKALHTTEPLKRAAARINLEDDELPALIKSGALVVRDPLTMGPHPCPEGEALRRAVLLPQDVRPLLEARGIGLRLIPYGTGPTLWTIGNAAAAIAAQEGFHSGTLRTLRDQMMQAASSGALTVRHPHSDMPCRPDTVSDFYHLMTPADVNAWLEQGGASYRWKAAQGRDALPPTTDAAASARILMDFEEGWASFWVVLAMVCEAKGLTGEARKRERDALTAAAMAGELPVHSSENRYGPERLELVRKGIRNDHIVKADDLFRWYADKTGQLWSFGPLSFPSLEGAVWHPPKPRPSTSRASDRAACDGPHAQQSHATDRGRRLKRATLIAENVRRWVSIERDLRDAAKNGLSSAARDTGGFWWEGSAQAWAGARGKLKEAAALGLAALPTRTHRLEG